jgi:hypothetical protein
MFESKLFYRRELHLLAAPNGPVGLRHHCHYLLMPVDELLQRRHGKFRCAEKYYAKAVHSVPRFVKQFMIYIGDILPGSDLSTAIIFGKQLKHTVDLNSL